MTRNPPHPGGTEVLDEGIAMRRSIIMPVLGAIVLALGSVSAASASSDTSGSSLFRCDDNGALCAEPADPLSYEGNYIGHDEPSLLFYSNVPGSGNNQHYR